MVGQDAKGQMRAVDAVISDEGRGVKPLRGRRARALPHCTRLRRSMWRPWRLIELGGVVVALEAGPWKTAMGPARVFDAEAGGWTDEQMSVATCSFWCGER